MSRQGWLHVGLVPCRDMTFCVATVGLQCGTEVCRDRDFPVTTKSALLVSRHSLFVSRQGMRLGRLGTHSTTRNVRARDNAQCAHA